MSFGQVGDNIVDVLNDAGESFIFRVSASPDRNQGLTRVCSCVDAIYHQPNPDCPICFGTGFIYDTVTGKPYNDYTVLGYFWHVESAQFWARVGQLNRGDAILYCQIPFEPRTGDIILKSGSFWGRPLGEFAVWNDAPQTYRGQIKFHEIHLKPRIYKSVVEK